MTSHDRARLNSMIDAVCEVPMSIQTQETPKFTSLMTHSTHSLELEAGESDPILTYTGAGLLNDPTGPCTLVRQLEAPESMLSEPDDDSDRPPTDPGSSATASVRTSKRHIGGNRRPEMLQLTPGHRGKRKAAAQATVEEKARAARRRHRAQVDVRRRHREHAADRRSAPASLPSGPCCPPDAHRRSAPAPSPCRPR